MTYYQHIIRDKDDVSFIYYERSLYTESEKNNLWDWLNNMDGFIGGDVNGKQVSRRQKWCHMDNYYFEPSWKNRFKRWESQPYDHSLLTLQEQIQYKINEIHDHLPDNVSCHVENPVFNSVLLNHYKNGDNIITKHSDNQNVFGISPTIAILSIGGPRTLKFTRKVYNPDNIRTIKVDHENRDKNIDVVMESGSLLIMGGMTQRYFFHSIDKEDNANERYSITFLKKL